MGQVLQQLKILKQESENNALNVYAKGTISKGEEITINYINAPDYVDKAQVAGYKK